MHEYEVLIETINPCGGEAHSKKEFLDIEAESPEAYVRAEGRWPVLDTGKNMDGDVVITTGDGKGIFVVLILWRKASKFGSRCGRRGGRKFESANGGHYP